MTPEQIARRYEELAGFELVDYAEAALPVWQLNIEAVSVLRRGLQPMKEFVLRSLEAGLASEDLPGFLGLDDTVVRGVLADLLSDRHVSSDPDTHVTDLGRQALVEGISSPANEVLPVLFDGVLRRPVVWSSVEFAYPREVEDGVVAEIPATPATPPSIGDLSLPDIDQVLHDQVGGRAEMNRDILRLKRIVKSRRHFRRGVALLFRSSRGEVRTRFIVNGIPDEQLEQSFAEHGGNLRKGLVRAFSDGHVKAYLRSHLGTDVAKRVLESADYRERQTQRSIAELRLSGLKRRSAMVERGELLPSDVPSAEALRQAEEASAAAHRALEQPDARPAAVYEKAELLERALTEPQQSLSISTRGFAPHIVNDRFLSRLEKLMQRGVHVTLTVHSETASWRARGKDWAQAMDRISNWAKSNPAHLRLRVTKQSRYYHVSWDGRVALVANRPMLSNHGRNRAFDQFAGFVLQEPSLVADYLTRVNK